MFLIRARRLFQDTGEISRFGFFIESDILEGIPLGGFVFDLDGCEFGTRHKHKKYPVTVYRDQVFQIELTDAEDDNKAQIRLNVDLLYQDHDNYSSIKIDEHMAIFRKQMIDGQPNLSPFRAEGKNLEIYQMRVNDN